LSLVQIFGAHILSWYGLEPSKVSHGTLLTLQVAVVFASLTALVNQQLAARRRYGAMAGLSIVYLVTLLLAGYFNGHGAASVANAIVASYLVTLMMGMAIVRRSQAAPTTPSAAHDSDAAYWSTRARRYGQTGWTNQAIYHYDQTLRLKLVKTTVGQLGLPANARCLDYGCGAGDFTRMLSAMGLNVLGYDPSSAVIDVAHGQGVARNARFTTRIEDLTAHGPYRLTLAVTVFQHILDDASLHSAIERVVQCMDDGGHLVLIESCTQATERHVRGRTAEAARRFTSAVCIIASRNRSIATLQPTPSFRPTAQTFSSALRVPRENFPRTRWLKDRDAEADKTILLKATPRSS
jgi:SAM-dependent methyltransferase